MGSSIQPLKFEKNKDLTLKSKAQRPKPKGQVNWDFGFWASGFGLRTSGFGLWSSGFDLWVSVFGLWSLGFGLQASVFGLFTWYG